MLFSNKSEQFHSKLFSSKQIVFIDCIFRKAIIILAANEPINYFFINKGQKYWIFSSKKIIHVLLNDSQVRVWGRRRYYYSWMPRKCKKNGFSFCACFTAPKRKFRLSINSKWDRLVWYVSASCFFAFIVMWEIFDAFLFSLSSLPSLSFKSYFRRSGCQSKHFSNQNVYTQRIDGRITMGKLFFSVSRWVLHTYISSVRRH